jgi:hypothetical protein
LGPFGTTATKRHIVPAPGDYDKEICGMMIIWGNQVLGENLPQWRFVRHKPHMLCPDTKPGRRRGKPAINRLTYGTALPTGIYCKRYFYSSKYSIIKTLRIYLTAHTFPTTSCRSVRKQYKGHDKYITNEL